MDTWGEEELVWPFGIRASGQELWCRWTVLQQKVLKHSLCTPTYFPAADPGKRVQQLLQLQLMQVTEVAAIAIAAADPGKRVQQMLQLQLMQVTEVAAIATVIELINI